MAIGPAYEKIAALLPEDGAAMADLALCLQRLDRKAEAIAANQKAIALAGRTELSREGDAATRRHAYFNLGKLGVAIELPSSGCQKLPAAPGCGSALWACVQAGEAYGSGGGSSWHVARIAVSQEEAEIGKDDDPLPAMPSIGLSGHASDSVAWERDHNFFQRAPSVDVLADKLDQSFCHEGASDDCGQDDGETKCAVVTADACPGLVGVVCPGGATGRDRDAVDEFYLEPAK
jgi:hypothetical protein